MAQWHRQAFHDASIMKAFQLAVETMVPAVAQMESRLDTHMAVMSKQMELATSSMTLATRSVTEGREAIKRIIEALMVRLVRLEATLQKQLDSLCLGQRDSQEQSDGVKSSGNAGDTKVGLYRACEMCGDARPVTI